MQRAVSPDKKEYYKIGVKSYLKNNEDPEKCPQILNELKEAYKIRTKHIEQLYHEIKEIKRLSV